MDKGTLAARLEKVLLFEEDVTNKIEAKPIANAMELIKNLDSLYIVPQGIAKAEDGLCFTFCKGTQKLYVELYNDGEYGWLFVDDATYIDRGILENETVDGIGSVVARIIKLMI